MCQRCKVRVFWTPVTGFTKLNLWFIVPCRYPRFPIPLYPAHVPEWMVVPSAAHCWMMGNSVAASRGGAGTKNPSFAFGLYPPKTHRLFWKLGALYCFSLCKAPFLDLHDMPNATYLMRVVCEVINTYVPAVLLPINNNVITVDLQLFL